MHSFDIQKQDTVLDAWRGFDKRTTEEGEKAKDIFFGKKKDLWKEAQDRRPRINEKSLELLRVGRSDDLGPAEEISASAVSGSSYQRDLKQKTEAQTKNVLFGQPSPPRSNLRTLKQGEHDRASHASRWASYSDLPASFNQATSSDQPPSTTAKDGNLAEANKNIPRSAFDVMAGAAADKHVRSSTMQVPSTPKQSKEYQPLLEMFWKQNAQRKGIEAKTTGRDYHPILDLYETQLLQLSASNLEQKPSSDLEAEKSISEKEATPTAATSQASNEADRLQTPGELLMLSIQSLLHGVGQLASAFKLTNSELQHQIEVAQKDIPRNIEKALKSSLTTLDSLRCSLPQAKSPPLSPQAHKGTQAERPSTSDQSTNTASPLEQAFLEAKADTIAALDSASTKLASAQPAEKEALSPVTDIEQEETKRQNDRVDIAVESMRVELLNTGWKPDSRVYTRADLLEEFLASFIGLRTTVEAKEQVSQASSTLISPMSVPNTELSTSAAPPVPLKVKDDDLPALERPYSWDMDYSASKPSGTATSEGLDLLTPSFEEFHPQIPLPCPQCTQTFSDRGALTWHVEQHDLQADIQERKAYKFPSGDSIDEEWKPLTAQSAQTYAYQPYVFNPANVMEAPPTKYQPYFPRSYEPSGFENPTYTERHEAQSSQYPLAELADDKVLEKYPTISQLEHRRQVPRPKSNKADSRALAHVSFKEPIRTRDTNSQHNDRGAPSDNIYKCSDMLNSIRDKQQQRMSGHMSMPVMRSNRMQGSTTGAAPLYQDFPFQAPASTKRTSALHKSASTSFRPARAYEPTSSIQRSNTTAGPSTKEQTKRGPTYKPYEPAKYRPATPGPAEQTGIKVADCKARLVEFGFDASHAANVSKLVKGDLEEAIDILEEDASVRKAWKGKGRSHGERRRHVPGAFDDEIYG